MKTIFTLCAVLVCGVTLANDGTTSVLNHGQPTAAVPAPAAPVAVTSQPATVCETGQCRLQKTYTAQEQSHDTTRRRLFGGYVIRQGNRTVLRPAR